MSFDEIIDRRGTHCAKWDKMEAIYGVPADDGIAPATGKKHIIAITAVEIVIASSREQEITARTA